VAREQLFNHARPNVTKLAVVITDGTGSSSNYRAEADLLKAQNVEVFCVGVTSHVRTASSRFSMSANKYTTYILVSK